VGQRQLAQQVPSAAALPAPELLVMGLARGARPRRYDRALGARDNLHLGAGLVLDRAAGVEGRLWAGRPCSALRAASAKRLCNAGAREGCVATGRGLRLLETIAARPVGYAACVS